MKGTRQSLFRFRVEAQEPCGAQVWCQLKPPAYYRQWDEGVTHDGLWEAESEEAAIRQFLEAYPNRHPDAKPYLRFRVFIPPTTRTFELIEVTGNG